MEQNGHIFVLFWSLLYLTGVHKKQHSVLEEETNSYFDFLGEIYLIFHVNNSKNRDFEI